MEQRPTHSHLYSHLARRGVAPAVVMTIAALSLLRAGPAAAQQATRRSQGSTGRAPASAAAPVVIKDVTVIDVQDGTRIPHQTVVIKGTRVRALGPVREITLPAGARVVSGRGRYLIPGLWDMHVRVHGDCTQDVMYPLFIANGVTGIRGIDVPEINEALRTRREVAEGKRVGPRAVLGGPSLGWGDGHAVPDCHGRPTHRGANTPDSARLIVDSLKTAGFDFLNVYKSPSRAVYFAIAAEARRVGFPFGGHLPWNRAMTIAEASDSGWRVLERLSPDLPFCEQPAECAAVAARFKRNGTWVMPTLTIMALIDKVLPARPERLRYWPGAPDSDAMKATPPTDDVAWMTDSTVPRWVSSRRQASLLRQAGQPMLAGAGAWGWWLTSSPWLAPGFALHDELRLLVRAGGLTPLEALQAATLNPAAYLRATDSLGSIRPGKLADLVLLDADPLTAIENTTRINAVVANGRLFDRQALDALLAEAARAAERRRAAVQGQGVKP